mmetsp:Transcript_17597/g.52878  ORF Transcript_17597/g.52878 Transcript_17597/m.52878 type:complete len:333 (+) Transcript_17597:785-1783(+)
MHRGQEAQLLFLDVGHVADRKHVLEALHAQVGPHLDVAAAVQCRCKVGRIEPLGVGLGPDSPHHEVCLHRRRLAALLRRQPHDAAGALLGACVQLDVHAVLLEPSRGVGGRADHAVTVVRALQQPFAAVHQGDLLADVVFQDLARQLHPDRSAANDDYVLCSSHLGRSLLDLGFALRQRGSLRLRPHAAAVCAAGRNHRKVKIDDLAGRQLSRALGHLGDRGFLVRHALDLAVGDVEAGDSLGLDRVPQVCIHHVGKVLAVHQRHVHALLRGVDSQDCSAGSAAYHEKLLLPRHVVKAEVVAGAGAGGGRVSTGGGTRVRNGSAATDCGATG